MKLEKLVLAKCINNIDNWTEKTTELEINKYYVVNEINIGQSHSNIKINNKYYNSIQFEYYEIFDDMLIPLNIYEKYSPYRKVA